MLCPGLDIGGSASLSHKPERRYACVRMHPSVGFEGVRASYFHNDKRQDAYFPPSAY